MGCLTSEQCQVIKTDQAPDLSRTSWNVATITIVTPILPDNHFNTAVSLPEVSERGKLCCQTSVCQSQLFGHNSVNTVTDALYIPQ